MLNLLPWRVIRAKKERAFILIFCTVCVIGTSGIISLFYNHLHKKYQAILNDKAYIIQTVTDLKKQQQQLNPRTISEKAMEDPLHLIQRQQSLIKVLQTVMQYFPDSSYLSSLAYQDQKLILRGVLQSNDPQLLKRFINTLQRKARIKVVMEQLKNVSLQTMEYTLILFLSEREVNATC